MVTCNGLFCPILLLLGLIGTAFCFNTTTPTPSPTKEPISYTIESALFHPDGSTIDVTMNLIPHILTCIVRVLGGNDTFVSFDVPGEHNISNIVHCSPCNMFVFNRTWVSVGGADPMQVKLAATPSPIAPTPSLSPTPAITITITPTPMTTVTPTPTQTPSPTSTPRVRPTSPHEDPPPRRPTKPRPTNIIILSSSGKPTFLSTSAIIVLAIVLIVVLVRRRIHTRRNRRHTDGNTFFGP